MSSKKITERRVKLRTELFPKLISDDFWNRKKSDGFTTIPRTMPFIIAIIDALTKGQAAGATYFDLWCRAFDEYLVDLKNDNEMALASGFSGERAIYTWRLRLEAIRKLGFIETVGEPRRTHAVILNPYKILKKHQKNVPKDLWTALITRMTEVGADDFERLNGGSPNPGAANIKQPG